MKINHITILVKDNKKAAEYYADVLELGEVKVVNDKHYWIKIGDVYLHLAANSGKPIANTFYHFAVEVDDFASYVSRIKERGLEVKEDGQQYFVRDLDGNLIELIDSSNNFFK